MKKSAAVVNPPTNPESSRQLSRDLGGIALAGIAAFLFISLLTRDVADPIEPPVWPLNLLYAPDTLVYPENTSIHNACGYWGALISAAMLDGVGVGVCLIMVCIGVLAVLLLIQRIPQGLVIRSLGATLVLIAVCTAAGLFPWHPAGFSIVGMGGYLGAMTSSWLAEHFASGGAWILTLTLFTFGTLLTTDYILVHVGRSALTRSAAVSANGIRRMRSAIPHRKRVAYASGTEGTNVPFPGTQSVQNKEDPDQDPIATEPVIRIRGKKVSRSASDDTKAAQQEPSDLQDPGAPSNNADSIESSTDDTQNEDDEPTIRMVDIKGKKQTIRQDSAHSEPLVKKKHKKEEHQQVFDDVREDLPEGVDDYSLPSLELLTEGDDVCFEEQERECHRKAAVLEETFKHFGFDIKVVAVDPGPVIAQYEIEMEAGLRLSKIMGLSDDLAIALRVPSVRIVAPIPGKNTVGIEVPNENRQVVRLREVIEETSGNLGKIHVPIFLGKDVSGNPLTVDLTKMPHLLIAGRTGTGKSVCLNAIISSILMTCRPDEVRMLMIDPKMVELSGYGRLPHLMHPVITDMKKAEAILAWAVEKMEERYSLLAKVGVRHITGYNALDRDELASRLEIDDKDQHDSFPDQLPFIVIIADEMADLMMTAGKDVETHIIRLAQKSRAVGIHLILATQKPTVDVITGLIKSNLPARLSFQVASKTDSRVVLDENGADKLLGNGDMLYLWPGTSKLIRGQGTFLDDEEIDRICNHCCQSEQNFVNELVNLKVKEDESEGTSPGPLKKRDDLYESAVDIVVREGRGSCSLLQRCLGIGYGRAARLIDYMAEDKIVGEYNASKAREVLVSVSDWEAMQGIEPTESNSGSAEDGLATVPEQDDGEQWEDVY